MDRKWRHGISRRRFLMVVVVCAAMVTTGSAQKSAQKSFQKGKTAVAATAIFELRLDPVEAGLVARLENRSSVPQRVLYDADLQPSLLTLTDAAGKVAKVFDERTRSKVDTRVSNGMYSEIAPGKSKELERVRFEKGPDGYEVEWGPYRIHEIRPGKWKAHVSFESKIDWVTSEGGQVPPDKPAWKGKLVSNEVEITLP